jgi:poly(beta-D-mannuronate) lyase
VTPDRTQPLRTPRLPASRRRAATLAAGLVALLAAVSPVRALSPDGIVFFDPAVRAAELARPDRVVARDACLAIPRDPAWVDLAPLPALEPTDGYGSDGRTAPFSWAVMVLGGRALAGDRDAAADLTRLLTRWAEADALAATPVSHDPYYALKRTLLPTIAAYAIVRPGLSVGERSRIDDWLGDLVPRVDRTFDGDVDRNNHRYLADSVLMAWGALVGDQALYDKGLARYRAVLADARDDGSLPLEARRGSRALWYTRHALTSLVVMAEIAKAHGDDLYGASVEGRGFDLVLSFLTNGLAAPALTELYAAANVIPGPSDDFRTQDLGFLAERAHGRNYMAFVEAVRLLPPRTAPRRLIDLRFDTRTAAERPLIDEYVGGNATCFWAQE